MSGAKLKVKSAVELKLRLGPNLEPAAKMQPSERNQFGLVTNASACQHEWLRWISRPKLLSRCVWLLFAFFPSTAGCSSSSSSEMDEFRNEQMDG